MLGDETSKTPIGPKVEDFEGTRMPLWEHLDELRGLLIRSLIAVTLGLCVTWYFAEPIVHYLEIPLLRVLPAGERHLYFTGVADKFFIYLKVAFLVSVALVSPYLFYLLWRFLSPALYKKEKRFIIPFVFCACFTFFVGLSFAFYVIVPFGYQFLINFGSPDERAIITLTEYFALTLKLMLAMGLIFEMPVILVLLAKFGIIGPAFLTKYRRHALVVNAIIAAVATPTPDAFTMILVMVPLCLLYEIGILGVKFVTRDARMAVADNALL